MSFTLDQWATLVGIASVVGSFGYFCYRVFHTRFDKILLKKCQNYISEAKGFLEYMDPILRGGGSWVSSINEFLPIFIDKVHCINGAGNDSIKYYYSNSGKFSAVLGEEFNKLKRIHEEFQEDYSSQFEHCRSQKKFDEARIRSLIELFRLAVEYSQKVVPICDQVCASLKK